MADIIYRSALGSEVTLSGKHHGIVTIELDWYEEEACIEGDAEFMEFNSEGVKEPGLMVTCECCEPMWIPVKVDVLDSLAS